MECRWLSSRGPFAGADLERGADTFNYENNPRGRTQGTTWERDGGGLLSLRIYNLNKPIIARVRHGDTLLDLRTVDPADDPAVAGALSALGG